MRYRFTAVIGTIVLVIGLATLASSALASGGKGNGNSGNSASSPSSSQPTSQPSHGNSGSAPGHAKSSGSHGSVASPTNSSAKPGVKPASTTAHNTSAPATSNKTKLYGNGKTAGQIAVSHGYTGTLKGPGNSQPHKVVTCGHKHGVDVHALKSHAASQNCVTSGSSTVTLVLRTSSGQTTSVVVPATRSGVAAALAAHPGARVVGIRGGVLGALASRGGVLGALAAKRKAQLPFTGFPVWVVLLIGLGLMTSGLAVRRTARSTA